MTIQSIHLHRICVPYGTSRRKQLEQHDPYNMATAKDEGMESLLVRITTADGLTGWGEAFGHKCNPSTWAALAEVIGPYLLGRPSQDPAALQEQVLRTFHGFGQTGPVLYALSGIDIALWDIAAQRAGKPLHALLGSNRSTVDTYPSLPCYGDPEEIACQIQRVLALGYRRIKLHETALPVMDAALDAMPQGTELMVDVNCPWSREEAATVARHLKARGMGWLEEPIWPPDDLPGLASLRKETGMTISAGENASGVQGLLQHFALNAIDVAQPSVAKIGGVTGMLQVFEAARQHGVRVVPHCFYYGPGLLATAHLVACLPQETPLEIPFLAFQEKAHAWLNYQPSMALPAQPGLGFRPDADVMARHELCNLALNA